MKCLRNLRLPAHIIVATKNPHRARQQLLLGRWRGVCQMLQVSHDQAWCAETPVKVNYDTTELYDHSLSRFEWHFILIFRWAGGQDCSCHTTQSSSILRQKLPVKTVTKPTWIRDQEALYIWPVSSPAAGHVPVVEIREESQSVAVVAGYVRADEETQAQVVLAGDIRAPWWCNSIDFLLAQVLAQKLPQVLALILRTKFWTKNWPECK